MTNNSVGQILHLDAPDRWLPGGFLCNRSQSCPEQEIPQVPQAVEGGQWWEQKRSPLSF